jgi:hypothetical protein
MSIDTYQPRPGPPTTRLWDEADVQAYCGFHSVAEIMARHPDFPRPLPLRIKGKRWRPDDVISFFDRLAEDGPAPAPTPTDRHFDKDALRRAVAKEASRAKVA